MARDFAAASEYHMLFVLKVACSAYAGEGPLSRFSVNRGEVEGDAAEIGRLLNARGGAGEMGRFYGMLGSAPGVRLLEVLWDGIGDWRG